MKHLFTESGKLRKSLLYVTVVVSAIVLVTSCKPTDPPKPVLKISTLATGLAAPSGLEVDRKGMVWVAQGGTGKNDGKVSVITPDGKKYDAIINFESVAFEGEADGPSHLLFADGLLYILGTKGKMYKANVSGYKPGDAPSWLPALEWKI